MTNRWRMLTPSPCHAWPRSGATLAIRALPAGVIDATTQRSSWWVTAPASPWSPPVSISSHTVVARSAPSPAIRVLNESPNRRIKSWADIGQAAKQTVGGEYEQPRIVHSDEHHQDVIGRMVAERPLFGRQFVAVVAGGFIAVVAVGDEDRLGLKTDST